MFKRSVWEGQPIRRHLGSRMGILKNTGVKHIVDYLRDYTKAENTINKHCVIQRTMNHAKPLLQRSEIQISSGK